MNEYKERIRNDNPDKGTEASTGLLSVDLNKGLEMITPIRGRKYSETNLLYNLVANGIRNDNPDKGTEALSLTVA